MFSSKLFHLDLKGAPPKMIYLEELFPFVAKLGITGVLIEYEDMFPYKDSLSNIACHHAYSEQDIERIIEIARGSNLKIIPLTQTFGHLEYVLKHTCYSAMREVERYPNVICPSNPNSFSIITSMISQIVDLHLTHGHLDAIHIGADEVWHLAYCSECQRVCHENNWSKDHLFVDYVTRIAKYVKNTYSLEVIMWDDMLRTISSQIIIDSQLNQLVTPMIWHYLDVTSFRLNHHTFWATFCQLFDRIWIASAFKGASKIKQMVPPIEYHVSNHTAWIEVVQKFSLQNKLVGIALTGWQRFDHFTTLCELLPVSIPCLTICATLLVQLKFDQIVLQKASQYLNCSNKLFPLTAFDYEDSSLTFPGARIFQLCSKLSFLREEVSQLISNPSFEGGFTRYQVRHNRVNPLHIDAFILKARVLSIKYEEVKLQLEKELECVFWQDTIEEWMEENVYFLIRKLAKIVTNADNQLCFNQAIKP